MPPADTRAAAALLAVFAAHNLEETWHLPRDLERLSRRAPVDLSWIDRRSYFAATVLLTALAAGAAGLGVRYRGTVVGEGLSVAVGAALLGNSLTHVGRAVADRAYNGGLATAPLMGWCAGQLLASTTGALTRRQRWLVGLGTNAAVPPLIVVALRTGRRLTKHAQGEHP